MKTARAEHPNNTRSTALVRAVLNGFDSAAVVIENRSRILAANAAWHELFGSSDCPPRLPSVSEWLAQLTDGVALAALLETSSAASGHRTVSVSHHGRSGTRQFTARVSSSQDESGPNRTHCVVLVDAPPHSSMSLIEKTQDMLHRLLVRQTLIEERERRRLGRALHDQVTQVLIHLRRRSAEARDGRRLQDPAEVIADIDHVVHLLQELTANFSPPVLEDLGLLPAMHWLADHLQSSYGAAASCEDDGMEPHLSSEVRTIVFRALRELANNAIRHAPGARILLRSRSENSRCLLEVCDDGPGFALTGNDAGTKEAQPFPGYGLLSIEQQIRAIGGTFEIRSEPGEGTQVVIAVSRSSDGQRQEQKYA